MCWGIISKYDNIYMPTWHAYWTMTHPNFFVRHNISSLLMAGRKSDFESKILSIYDICNDLQTDEKVH